MLKNLLIAVAITAMACCSNATAQYGGYGGGYGGYGGGYAGSYGYAGVNTGHGCGGGLNNCGRTINQHDAEALWSDYCSENCESNQLFSGLRGRCGCGRGAAGCGHGAGGCGGASDCGCNQGCFGYPAGGCGCNAGGGGLASGLLAGHRGGGCGKCGLKGLLSCGCKKKRSKCHASPCGDAPVDFAGDCDTCGCSGSGSYFSQPVGYDYGTAGMHSVVQGCTGGCTGAPASHAAQPAHAPQVIGHAVSGSTAAEQGIIPASVGTN